MINESIWSNRDQIDTARRSRTGFPGRRRGWLRRTPQQRLESVLPDPAGDQGHGYASELVEAARQAARDVRPQLPVAAFLLEHNVASRRTAERAGLQLVWRGPDAGNPDPDAVRLVYADRPLTEHDLAAMIAHP